jgi:hypothetical protein
VACGPQQFAVAFLAVALAAGCGGGAGSDTMTSGVAPSPDAGASNAPKGAFRLLDAEVTPYAIWADEIETREITVRVRTGGAGSGIHFEVVCFDEMVGGSGELASFPLFDDGTQGDVIAGDGVWTRAFALGFSEPPILRLYDGQLDRLTLSVVARDAEGNVVAPAHPFDARLDLGVLSPTRAREPTPRAVSAVASISDHVVNLVIPGFDGNAASVVGERLYALYPDDPFDFLVVFSTRLTGDGIPRSIGVRNDAEGIHRPRFDASASFGSAGRLSQVVLQNARVLGVELNHEIGHRWASYLDAPALDLTRPHGVHWGPSNHVGQMGNGPYLEAVGGGRHFVTNAEDSEKFTLNPFSTLELYLMGLVGPEAVAPLRFVTDPAVTVQFGQSLDESATRRVTIDDIVSVYGPRRPAAPDSQKDFRAAIVVVSDRALADTEWALSETVARYVEGTSAGGVRSGGLFDVVDPPAFAAATGFRATLRTELPIDRAGD